MKEEQIKEILKIVKDNYEEIAVDFDLTRRKPIWPELVEIVANTKSGSSVLDVGCGNGRLLEAFQTKQINYLGLDASKQLIALAKKNYPGRDFIVKDILDLKSLDKKFDLVISVAVLHHLPSFKLRLEALNEMLAVTAPQGMLIFSVWRMWNNKKYKPLLYKNIWQKITGQTKLEIGDLLFPWKKGDSQRYYHAFTKHELNKLVRAAGYKNFELVVEAHNYWIIIKK